MRRTRVVLGNTVCLWGISFEIPQSLEGNTLRVQRNGETVELKSTQDGWRYNNIFLQRHPCRMQDMSNFFNLTNEREWSSHDVVGLKNGSEETLTLKVKKE